MNSLIRVCQKCGTEIPANAPEGGCSGCLLETARDAAGGQVVFGRYKLVKVLGRGGMGIVWLARDEELERDVALKFLPDLMIQDRALVNQLKRETKRCLELTHPHVVRIYDFVHDERSGCISMEYVDGETLSNLRAEKEQKVFEPDEVAGWISQLCDALDYAHNHAKVIHRDLKPANLMVNQRGDLKVADFGIARSLVDSASRLTAEEGRSGTLVYMSPQQLSGEHGTHLDDIYSLGATIYELLTSKPPFYSGNIDRQICERVAPSMTKRRKEFDIEPGSVPPVWEDTVAACLAKDPSQRPQSATEVAQRLQLPSGQARRRTTPGKPANRKPLLIGGIVAATALLLASVYFAASKRHAQPVSHAPEISEKSIAVLPFENRSEEKANAYFADGIQDEILTRLSKIADLKVISRTSTQHYKSAPENLPEIARQLGVAHILKGSVQKSGDVVRVNVQLIKAVSDSHLWADTFDRKLTDTFSVESEVARAIADQLRAHISGQEEQVIAAKPTDNPEAYDAYLRGLAFFRQANALSFRKAANSFTEATQLDPNFAAAWAALSRMHSLLYFWNDDVTPARSEAAHSALETALRLQPDLPEVHLAQAYYQYWIVRDYEGARIIFERLRKNLPNSAEIAETLGYIARRQGRWNESRSYIDAAVALNPRYLYLRWQAAAVCEEMRDFSSALQRYDEALNIWPDDANLLAGKATVYQCLGRLDKAEETLQGLHARAEETRAVRAIYYQAILRRHYPAAIALLRSLVEMDDSPAAMPRNIYRTGLGDLQRLSGDSTAAKASYSQARAELEETLKGQPKNTGIIITLAIIHAGLGEQEAATKYAERAVSLVPISKDALNGSAYEENRARIAARFGDREIAIPILERLLKAPCAEPPITPALLKLDPDFDVLRGDARFQSLCQEKKR